jgi:DNA-binding response OmpR family regulator
MTAGLQGKRVLLAEDFFGLAMMVRQMLENAGCVVIGPVPSVEKGLAMAEGEALDAALLDVSLKDGKVFPLAERLQERQVPFIFTTAYDDAWAIPERYRTAPRVTKPFSEEELYRQMSNIFTLEESPKHGAPTQLSPPIP